MKKILLIFICAPLFLIAQRRMPDSNAIPGDSFAKMNEDLKIAYGQYLEAKAGEKAQVFRAALNKRKQVILAESAIIILLTSVTLAQAMKIKKLKRNS